MDVKAGHGWGGVATLGFTSCHHGVFSYFQSGPIRISSQLHLYTTDIYNLLSDMLSTRSGYIIESGIINGR